MTQPRKQAGKLLFLAVFLLSQPVLAEAVDNSGPAGAGGERPVALSDITSGLSDVFESIVPSKESVLSLGGLLDRKDGAQEGEEKKEPDTIKAKRLDGKTDDKEKIPDIAGQPYRIYPSPVIVEDSPSAVDPYEAAAQRGDAATFSGWDAADSKAMEVGKQESSSREAGPEEKEEKSGEIPPISALPKQFFPILPFGSLPSAQPQLLPVASSRPLDADGKNIRRAIIVIHDLQRGAAENVATLMTLNGGDSRSTLILAPQFPLELDILRFGPYLPNDGKNVARWPVDKGWQTGGDSFLPSSKTGVSSFAAVDLLMMFLADRDRFPALRTIVLAGHGMGGDFVHRYAALGQASSFLKKDGVDLRFVVANPSSYLYFTAYRPSPQGPAFMKPEQASCPQANVYPYGLDALNAYGRHAGASAIRLDYPERKVVYLVGDSIVNDPYLDRFCAAQLEGESRLARARNYARHLVQSFGETVGKNQFFVFVPKAGYDPVSLYGSFCGMETLFGSGDCGQ